MEGDNHIDEECEFVVNFLVDWVAQNEEEEEEDEYYDSNDSSCSEDDNNGRRSIPLCITKKLGSNASSTKTSRKRKLGKEKKKDKSSRRDIRNIIDDSKLSRDTLSAQQLEKERLARLQQAQHHHQAATSSHSSSIFIPPVKKIELVTPPIKTDVEEEEDEIICLSGDEFVDEGNRSSTSLNSSSQSESVEDPGDFTDDRFNVPDEQGRLLINPGHSASDPSIFVPEHLAGKLKPHQFGGVRFMFSNIVEDLERFKQGGGMGCVLAHSMGLGKTLQIVLFSDILLRHTAARRIVILVPVNTLQNWSQEFEKWLPYNFNPDPFQSISPPPPYRKFVVNEVCKTVEQRANVIKDWYDKGGVLLMGYEMFRRMVTKDLMTPSQRYTQLRKNRLKSSKKAGTNKADDEVIDIEQQEIECSLSVEVKEALLDPGPDLIVCDEGHRIKNLNSNTAKILNSIRTKRRIVLTGSPLQNNLVEYWCMVNFVRPKYLGTKNEFMNMFERPIKNGQCVDSTPEDKHLARQRTCVLTNMLKGFVQRRGHALLHCILPKKHEWVVLIGKSDIQKKLYRRFLTYCAGESESLNPLKAFAICCKIWNHPDILKQFLNRRTSHHLISEEDEDLDDLDLEESSPKKKAVLPPSSAAASNSNGSIPRPAFQHQSKNGILNDFPSLDNLEFSNGRGSSPNSIIKTTSPLEQPLPEVGGFDPLAPTKGVNYSWAEDLMNDYEENTIEHGYKLAIAFAIIHSSVAQGDKVLVFSQSLFTLSLMEKYLSQEGEVDFNGRSEPWKKNTNYFRLDGSTNAIERQRLIGKFESDPTVSLFLISTRAGSLGINLTSANRAIVFDASWNPTHDTQAVCRIYRYGQRKETFIYRLVTDNSMEKSIFNRQLGKMGIADRVVDSKQSDANITRAELRHLMAYDPEKDEISSEYKNEMKDSEDDVLTTICLNYSHMLSQEPVRHESLMLEGSERPMTKAEMRRAQRAYEQELKESRGFGFSSNGSNGSSLYNSLATPSYINDRTHAYASSSQSGVPSHQFRPPPNPTSLLQFYGFGNNHRINKPMGIIRPQTRPSDSFLDDPNFLDQPNYKMKRIICSREASLESCSNPGSRVLIRPGTEATIVVSGSSVYLRTNDGHILDARHSPYDITKDPQYDQMSLQSSDRRRMMNTAPLPPLPPQIDTRHTAALLSGPECIDLCDSD